MPIGAIVGGASAAAGLAGSAISAGATKDASKAATDAATQNNALQQQIYGQNTANLTPFMSRGNAAGDEINALLGLGGGTAGSAASGGQFDANAYLAQNPDVAASYQQQRSNPGFATQFPTAQAFAQYHYANNGKAEGRSDPLTPVVAATPGASGAQSGLDTFLNSTNYKFQVGQGQDALAQSRLASAGGAHSGATLKAITSYGQNQAQSALGTYINYLSGQQGAGLSGANALAGVGTGYANAVSSNNNSAASATGNAALAGANGINGALGSATNTLGALYGSSYGGGGSNGSYYDYGATPATDWTVGL